MEAGDRIAPVATRGEQLHGGRRGGVGHTGRRENGVFESVIARDVGGETTGAVAASGGFLLRENARTRRPRWPVVQKGSPARVESSDASILVARRLRSR